MLKAARKRARKRDRAKFAARKTLQELRKRSAVPKWVSAAHRIEMGKIYRERDRLTSETSVQHHVDHIVPIRGLEIVNGHLVEVWGLHVPWNLRAIPGAENEKKSNKFLDISRQLFYSEFGGKSTLKSY